MQCPKCGSENTRVEIINETHIKRKRNWVYWLCGLWLIDIMFWMLFFLPRLILQLIKGKEYKMVNKQKKMLICNSCGYTKKL